MIKEYQNIIVLLKFKKVKGDKTKNKDFKGCFEVCLGNDDR